VTAAIGALYVYALTAREATGPPLAGVASLVVQPDFPDRECDYADNPGEVCEGGGPSQADGTGLGGNAIGGAESAARGRPRLIAAMRRPEPWQGFLCRAMPARVKGHKP
jgi:hypothetical protein